MWRDLCGSGGLVVTVFLGSETPKALGFWPVCSERHYIGLWRALGRSLVGVKIKIRIKRSNYGA